MDKFTLKPIRTLNEFVKEYYKGSEKIFDKTLMWAMPKPGDVIVDIGCYDGTFTIPIAKKFRKCKVIGIDISSKGLGMLQEKARKEGIKNITTIKADARNLRINSNSVGFVFSHWFFDMMTTEKEMEKSLKEFHRILKPNGTMIGTESVPFAQNKAQEFLVKADVFYSRKIRYWHSDEIAGLMEKVGFKNIETIFHNWSFKITPKASFDVLQWYWEASPKFIKRFKTNIGKFGLEFPLEFIIKGKK
jgi:ubiquinone/menaquinone biosynthesis C-methylase UbiE